MLIHCCMLMLYVHLKFFLKIFAYDIILWYNYISYKKGDTFMNITEVRVRLVNKDESKLKAVASMTIDGCFVIHDIKVIQGNEGLFISMPSRKTPEGEYKDIVHPINTETREAISKKIIEAYEQELNKAE